MSPSRIHSFFCLSSVSAFSLIFQMYSCLTSTSFLRITKQNLLSNEQFSLCFYICTNSFDAFYREKIICVLFFGPSLFSPFALIHIYIFIYKCSNDSNLLKPTNLLVWLSIKMERQICYFLQSHHSAPYEHSRNCCVFRSAHSRFPFDSQPHLCRNKVEGACNYIVRF